MIDKLDGLQKILYERLHRRPAGIDKLDRLWEAAVLLPLVNTPDGIALLFGSCIIGSTSLTFKSF